jgi:bifunctional DNase/RNase
VKHHQSPRPLTHDLLVAAVELMGGEFQDVVISEIKEHTYYAVIRVAKDGDVIEIDARPSDAIAVAVTCEPNLPIYVSEEVLENVLG